MRICFLGDSFVNGTGDDDALGWVGRVVANARQTGQDITAYNLGIRGDTSADIAARWVHEARLRLRAEHDGRLVFSFGANDCASNNIDHGPRIAETASLANANAILSEARAWLPTLMIGPATNSDDAQSNQRICSLSAGYGALCAKHGIAYLEICRLTLASPLWRQESLAGDGAHPNRGGYALVAQAVDGWPSWRAWTKPLPLA